MGCRRLWHSKGLLWPRPALILSVEECPGWVCAVQRRRFPVGANPIRQPLQPEAIGAVMEVTKWLKPSISVSQIGGSQGFWCPDSGCRSTMCIATLAFASAGLLDPHVPFDEA